MNNLLTVEKLSKTFTDKILFDEISFGINEGDKIGVIGVNGTGKSTLLKIIAGVENADSGTITTMNGLRIGYLPQMPEFDEGMTVINQVFKNDNPKMQTVKEYEEALFQVENNYSKEAEKKLIELTEKMDKEDAWGLESEAKTILTKLGITDFHKEVQLLSGGQRKRVAMAGALISPVDILIMDEPTNHIDNETVDWLENYLGKCTKSLLMVTHDRYFLDRVVNKTIELDKGKLYTYQGNYSQFLELKAEREELELAGERKRQNLLRRELAWIRRGAQARSTKQKARIERFEEVSAIKAPELRGSVEISVGASRLGRKTIEINNVSMSYEGKKYIDDFSYIILRDDRVGIIGHNGCGKSTLMNIITGRLAPDSGTVEIGDTVKIGVFAQDNGEMDENMRVIDYIKEVAEYVPTADGRITASQMLEKFLFKGDIQWSPISKLSGGEKRRLYLLRVLMAAPNMLFLDEPTNDLDIETLTILEEYLEDFPGAVVTVSHDRYFLDKMVNRIFSFEGNGKIKQYEGGYTDYKIQHDKEEVIENVEKPVKAEKVERKQEEEKPKKLMKMTYKDQREFDTINDRIEGIELKIAEIDEEISKCGSDYVKLQELTEEKEKFEAELDEAMDRWVYLNELNEEIERNKKGL
ncbi:ABC transporter [Tyzzerella sp. An114]|uniref:ABC-F family ATP-binding cassette domain-containing protein n=1 Tax=Tyzzerella sp. An114 TaxID=1965545 RepID=UPI000B451B99|nr:ABC-F family ATP-binding cassette domain-containing protein [Tyzzerella sp. An114]OUQ56483.1 ABC transporter [Tyzzerella sp. An114]